MQKKVYVTLSRSEQSVSDVPPLSEDGALEVTYHDSEFRPDDFQEEEG